MKAIAPAEALALLREGNQRFVEGSGGRHLEAVPDRRAELLEGQEPFAVVLGCSDSRVPVEIVFDRGLGDLFVIRVAGNVVAPSLVGSVEFAAEFFGTRLVVVLGHSKCGAVTATLDQLQRATGTRSPHLRSVVERIEPSVRELMDAGDVQDRETLIDRAVRANIRASADQLRHGSAILEELIAHDELLVVGAQYCLESGRVDFFDGVADVG